MARYIDADKFISELEQEKTVAIEFEDGVAVYEIEHMMNLIGMQPTADVVPKSEVERLQESNSSLQGTIVKLTAEIETLNEKNAGLALACMCDCMANEDCMGHNEWKAIKADVAREIFEEIEEVFRQHTEGGYYLNGAWFPERLDLYTGDAIAELKKKYTEDTI